MRSAFVTGASGFIGYHLVNELIDKGTEVYAMCRRDSANAERLSSIEGVNIVECSMENISSLKEILQGKDIEVFYHLAWLGPSGPLRSDYETQIKNILWTCNAAEVAAEMHCKKIVVTGTVAENLHKPIVMEKKFINSSYYLTAKNTAYEMTSSVCKKNTLPMVWCTFHHPFGVYNKKEQIIIATAYKMANKQELKFSSAENWFDVVDVRDLSRGLYLAGECQLKKDRYYIGSGKPQILRDYIEQLKKLFSPDADIQYGVYPPDKIPLKREELDISAFSEETGYCPEYSFGDTAAWVRDWFERTGVMSHT